MVDRAGVRARVIGGVLYLFLVTVAGAGYAGAECSDSKRRGDCAWQPGFALADLNGEVRASVVYDDGTGPTLYVGGDFLTAGGTVVNHIARWDGAAWSALSGPSGIGIGGSVYALAVYDDGSGPDLYAGGLFSTAGGVTASMIARWDGSSWSALSSDLDAELVEALIVFDDGSGQALYAGGWIWEADGGFLGGVARWDGNAWSALTGPSGTGFGGGDIRAFAVYDDGTGPALFMGGLFDQAGGIFTHGVVKWDGSSWFTLGSSGWPEGFVAGLAVFDDGSGSALYVGGSFPFVGGLPVQGIARWDGTSWTALSGPAGTGMDRDISVLAVFDDGSGAALYAGGLFTTAGGVEVNHVARWDGSTWSALSSPAGVEWCAGWARVSSIAVFDDGSGSAMYLGGEFTGAGGVLANGIVRWDGSAWSALSTPTDDGLNGPASSLAVFNDGSGPGLYTGGRFTTAGTALTSNVARWDGVAWSTLAGPSGNGADYAVGALAVYDDGTGPALYAGGSFETAGGVTVNRIARWDGSSWSALSGPSGTGCNTSVMALKVFDDGSGPALYAAGSFTTAGGVEVNRVARWDGSAWSALAGPVGTGMNKWVHALAVYDDGTGPALYAGGRFTTAGGMPASFIARWDGSGWSDLGTSGLGIDNYVYSLAVYDDGTGLALYAGGSLTTAGVDPANRIARWDGSSWSAFGGPTGSPELARVNALAVFDDGDGPALLVGGEFTNVNGVPMANIAKWDGSTWSALGGPVSTGMTDTVNALKVYDDGAGVKLYAAGSFTTAGGIASASLAAWGCDNAVPTDPTVLWCTSHTLGEWSEDNQVSVAWRDAGGAERGGYSVLFDTAPTTVPDTTVDVVPVADISSTTSVLDDGSRYFHLRACDSSGACSGGVHLGPLLIDADPPSSSFALISTSHTPGVASAQHIIAMVWSPADDAGSGLDGYAWEVTSGPGWSCDRVKDLEEGSTSLSTELGSGLWYVHLCAVDNLGHWGGVVSAGPYLIDTLLVDGFESGDTSAWTVKRFSTK